MNRLCIYTYYLNFSHFFQLVNKFGVDKEEKGPNKNRLWAKVTKEYNNITGNGHTKARLNKKWQNIKHQRKLKRQKLFDHEADDDPDALVDEDGKFNLLIFYEGVAPSDVSSHVYRPYHH